MIPNIRHIHNSQLKWYSQLIVGLLLPALQSSHRWGQLNQLGQVYRLQKGREPLPFSSFPSPNFGQPCGTLVAKFANQICCAYCRELQNRNRIEAGRIVTKHWPMEVVRPQLFLEPQRLDIASIAG